MNLDITQQKHFFDVTDHQYSVSDILHPPKAQQMEYAHMDTFLQLPQKALLLDYGCGSGRTTFHFLRGGYHVHAYDISETPLNELWALYKKYKEHSWGKLEIIHSVPLKKLFNAVVGADILHHIPLTSDLPRIHRSLLDSGVVVFSEPNPFHIPWYLYYMLAGRPLHIEMGILQCSLGNLHRQFIQAGFSKLHIEGHGILPTKIVPPLLGLDTFNANVLGNYPLLRHIAFRYIVTAHA